MIFYGYTGAASPSCRTSSFQMPPRGFDTGIDAGRTDAARKRAAPGRVRVRSLAARGAAGFLVAVAALVALPLAAQAADPFHRRDAERPGAEERLERQPDRAEPALYDR